MSVPLGPSDLHYSRWQSGEICQVLSTGAFTLLCHAFRFSVKVCSSSFFCCLAHALSAQCLLSSRPDTASIRSCLLLPPGFFDTREAGVWAGSRACFLFSFSSINSACDGMWLLISGSRREVSLQASPKFEGPAITWNCFWVLPVPLSRRLHRTRPFFLGTLGCAQKVLRLDALRVPPTIVDNDSTSFLQHWVVLSCLVHTITCFPFSHCIL